MNVASQQVPQDSALPRETSDLNTNGSWQRRGVDLLAVYQLRHMYGTYTYRYSSKPLRMNYTQYCNNNKQEVCAGESGIERIGGIKSRDPCKKGEGNLGGRPTCMRGESMRSSGALGVVLSYRELPGALASKTLLQKCQ